MDRLAAAALFLLLSSMLGHGLAAPAPSGVPVPPPRPTGLPAPPRLSDAPPVPLPPPRPDPAFGPPVPIAPEAVARPEFGPPAPAISDANARPAFGPPAPPKPLAAGPPPVFGPTAEDKTCADILAGGTIEASRAPAPADGGGCGIAVPVSLRRITLADGGAVAIEPPALIRCDLARQVAQWLREDLGPAIAGEGRLMALEGVGGYACRSRDRVLGAKLSEHGTGNALDIAAFRFASHDIAVTGTAVPVPFLLRARDTACARFSTVLGPGSDGFHATHLHLDLEVRRTAVHYCHWEMP